MASRRSPARGRDPGRGRSGASPAARIAVYLALADATLLLDTTAGHQVISDERVNQLAGRERAAANQVPAGSALQLRRPAQLTRALRQARNRPGVWPGVYGVAAADPQAASHGVTGTLPRRTLQRAVLLSDGAAGWSTCSSWPTWEELLALLDESGPEGRQWPRTKRGDDATALYLVLS